MELREFLVQNSFPSLGKWMKLLEPAAGSLSPPVAKAATQEVGPVVRRMSVIIPAHNEEEYLGASLTALQRQNYGWFEVIVVANGCTDRTVQVARGQCHKLIVLSQKNLGLARNLGARMAGGELLLFLDADTLLEPMALRRIAQDFSQEHAAGTIRGRPDEQRWKFKLFYAFKNALHRWSLHNGSSGLILCWKDQFMRVGGFDEALEVRENSELIRRLRRFGTYKYIGDITATTSMRRYQRRGVSRMAWVWAGLWLRSCFGGLRQHPYESVR